MKLEEILDASPNELSEKNPVVLSCGGIFIPQRERMQRNVGYQILHMPSDREPVKVVSGIRTSTILQRVMLKESQN